MIVLPEQVKQLIKKINDAGFKAYCVGGSIRDFLLGLTPVDFDIATDATPKQIKEIFRGFFLLTFGEEFGTISVKYLDKFYEVTTFRQDLDYTDYRHPRKVLFSKNIETDLQRRDFTINAFAYNEEEGLLDYFDGLDDLNKGIIRAVGNPHERFFEDALRIMRAIRFAVRFNFEIDGATFTAMNALKENLANISMERLREEFLKTIVEIDYKQWHLYYKFFACFIPELKTLEWDDDLFLAIDDVDANVIQRLTAIFYNYEKELPQILRRLKCPNKTIKNVIMVRSLLNQAIPTTKVEIKMILKNHPLAVLSDFLDLKSAYAKIDNDLSSLQMINYSQTLITEIFKNNEPYVLNDLKIRGDDLIDLGFKKGPFIKKVLNYLLDIIIENPEKNDLQTLTQIAEQILLRELII